MAEDTEPRDKERNRLTARIARTAKVGTNLSGVGISYAANSLFGGEKGDERIAKSLAAALGKSKGPLMKVAQMVSTIPDFLPEEYAEELAQLQQQAPAMGWPFVKRRMRAELGPGWQEKFAEFGKEASHAASLGQVHVATLHDGRKVACKLQYPDMASAVESDVSQLKTLLGLFKRLDGSIDPSEMVEEITDRLREELDYEREAKHMALYADMLSAKDFVKTPEPITDLSTDRLLTMTWVTGDKLDKFEGREPGCAQWYCEKSLLDVVVSDDVLRGDPRRSTSWELSGDGRGGGFEFVGLRVRADFPAEIRRGRC